jgi:hypothetical protein
MAMPTTAIPFVRSFSSVISAAAALATAALGLAALLARSLLRRLMVPLSDEALALAVERTYPHFGDSLLTSITLAAGAADDADPDLAVAR